MKCLVDFKPGTIEYHVSREYQSGSTLQEAQAYLTKERFGYQAGEVAKIFKQIEHDYKGGSIPVCQPKEVTDPLRREHLGLEGPGKQLREIIALHNNRKE